MTKHDQPTIIQEQMQANQRIIRASQAGQPAKRVTLNERIRQIVPGATHDKSAVDSHAPKSK